MDIRTLYMALLTPSILRGLNLLCFSGILELISFLCKVIYIWAYYVLRTVVLCQRLFGVMNVNGSWC
jgi:hypothetical protein